MPRTSAPPHLVNTDWTSFETKVVLQLLDELRHSLGKLIKKPTSRRVHAARVDLRRWQVVDSVLASKCFANKRYVKLRKELGRLRKSLGQLRNFEVMLALTKTFRLPKYLRRPLKKSRRRAFLKLKNLVELDKSIKLIGRLGKKLTHRQRRFETRILFAKPISVYGHLEPRLNALEENCRTLEPQADSAKDLHRLRIAIKQWRYFLTEFYGLTNLELVRAQQLLGKIHDLDELVGFFEKNQQLDDLDISALASLQAFRVRLMQNFDKIRKNMPYGLRPSISSLEAKVNDT